MADAFTTLWPGEPEDASQASWERATGDNALREDVAYRGDLIGWAVERLGIPRATLVWSLNDGYEAHVWDGTRDPLQAIANALERWEDVGVESGTGTGKSFFAAVAILWFLACWEGARVFTFAPKEDQLRLFIWMEIGKLWPRFVSMFPTAELTDLTIRMRGGNDESWGARGYAVGVRAGEDVATKAAGMHATDMLIVGEEWPGVPAAVGAAHENTCTGPHNLRLYLGNPDNQQDTLHTFCESPDVTAVRMSALDHPNLVLDDAGFIGGATSWHSVERRERKYGLDSGLYNSRVRGLAPLEATDALIKAVWVEEAVARYHDKALRKGKKSMGVDVANSENGDQAAICRGIGAVALEVDAFRCENANELGAEVVAECRADGVHPSFVGVDATGVGAGTVNEAKRLNFPLQALHSGGQFQTMDEEMDIGPGQKRVANVERFASKRGAMWWKMRDDLQHGRIGLPEDHELKMDLIAPTFWTWAGRIHVEAKEDVRSRLGRSTNKGDAVVYWNWVRPRRVEKEDPDLNEIDVWSPEVLAEDAKHRNKIKRRLDARKTQRNLHDEGDY